MFRGYQRLGSRISAPTCNGLDGRWGFQHPVLNSKMIKNDQSCNNPIHEQDTLVSRFLLRFSNKHL